jgi:uncharacterized protein HemY
MSENEQTVLKLHERAMELSDLGMIAKREGNHERARRRFRDALTHERMAAERVETGLEPTYSTLHVSAASLALDAGEYDEAKRLMRVIGGSIWDIVTAAEYPGLVETGLEPDITSS